MFDLIVNGHRNTTRRDFAPLVISWSVHALAIGAVVLLPLLFATNQSAGCPERHPDLRDGRCTAITPAAAPSRGGVRADAGCEASFASARRDPAAGAASTGCSGPRAPAVIDTVDEAEGDERFGRHRRRSGRRSGRCSGRWGPGGFVGGIVGAPLPPAPPPPAPRAPVRIGGTFRHRRSSNACRRSIRRLRSTQGARGGDSRGDRWPRRPRRGRRSASIDAASRPGGYRRRAAVGVRPLLLNGQAEDPS